MLDVLNNARYIAPFYHYITYSHPAVENSIIEMAFVIVKAMVP